MGSTLPANFADLWSANRDLQNQAFADVLEATSSPVDWACDVWVQNLKHKDNHNRACIPYGMSAQGDRGSMRCRSRHWKTTSRLAPQRNT